MWLFFRLTGRGIVELTIEKGDGSAFSPEAGGEPRKTATIQVDKFNLVEHHYVFLFHFSFFGKDNYGRLHALVLVNFLEVLGVLISANL